MDKQELRDMIQQQEDPKMLEVLWELYELKYMTTKHVDYRPYSDWVLTTNTRPNTVTTYADSLLNITPKIDSVESGFNPVTGE